MNHFNIQRHLESHKRTEKCKSVVTKADSAGSVKAKKMEKKCLSILVMFVGNILKI